MTAIKHCGASRATQEFWLNSNDSNYNYQVLLSADCICGVHVLEVQGVFHDGRKSAQNRIKQKDHKEWIARTKLDGGDLASVDTSQWKSIKAGVHRVEGSMPYWPFIFRQTQVK
jgi:hypothetical protein